MNTSLNGEDLSEEESEMADGSLRIYFKLRSGEQEWETFTEQMDFYFMGKKSQMIKKKLQNYCNR